MGHTNRTLAGDNTARSLALITGRNEVHRSRLAGPIQTRSAAISGVIDAALAIHAARPKHVETHIHPECGADTIVGFPADPSASLPANAGALSYVRSIVTNQPAHKAMLAGMSAIETEIFGRRRIVNDESLSA